MATGSDQSNGYEELAEIFMRSRSRVIGVSTVRRWAETLPANCALLDLGCGFGIPISEIFVELGLNLYAVDASPTLLAAFKQRLPSAHTQCAAVENSDFFQQQFEGIIAWGLIFLLDAEVQDRVLRKVSAALKPGGRFTFTSPPDPISWHDVMTGRESRSLGAAGYRQILASEGLFLEGEDTDEGENHYYFFSKPA